MISLLVLMINCWKQTFGFKGFIDDGVALMMACVAEGLLELIGVTIWSELK
jgi:hypothetical protein